MIEPKTIKKICYISSYKPYNYIRSTTTIRALESFDTIKLYKAQNTTNSIFRYTQALLRLVFIRLKYNPDLYFLGFRGNELFFFVRLITAGKPLVFDNFVSVPLSLTKEKKLGMVGYLIGILLYPYEYLSLKLSNRILTDTKSSADLQSKTFHVDIKKFYPLYLSTDEKVFNDTSKMITENEIFTVFTYATFLPLHGIDTILNACSLLSKYRIKFIIAGGKGKKRELEIFRKRVTELGLENVEHHEWIEFERLREYIHASDLCLGGPFGNTPQADIVITGKTFQFLAMGKAVVVGRNQETPLVGFKDKHNCLLVRQGDPTSLADSIKWTLQNQKSLRLIGKRGKDLYNSKFSAKETQTSLKKLLLQLKLI